eukprot:351222-Chlamydomonas_euryale.AAC.2
MVAEGLISEDDLLSKAQRRRKALKAVRASLGADTGPGGVPEKRGRADPADKAGKTGKGGKAGKRGRAEKSGEAAQGAEDYWDSLGAWQLVDTGDDVLLGSSEGGFAGLEVLEDPALLDESRFAGGAGALWEQDDLRFGGRTSRALRAGNVRFGSRTSRASGAGNVRFGGGTSCASGAGRFALCGQGRCALGAGRVALRGQDESRFAGKCAELCALRAGDVRFAGRAGGQGRCALQGGRFGRAQELHRAGQVRAAERFGGAAERLGGRGRDVFALLSITLKASCAVSAQDKAPPPLPAAGAPRASEAKTRGKKKLKAHKAKPAKLTGGSREADEAHGNLTGSSWEEEEAHGRKKLEVHKAKPVRPAAKHQADTTVVGGSGRESVPGQSKSPAAAGAAADGDMSALLARLSQLEQENAVLRGGSPAPASRTRPRPAADGRGAGGAAA